ncbi:biotin--[acetyl-CoA-carboxylase] ligase [Rhodococcus sp. D2-41]|uniref:biotin--[biotin carboxyl-carrier protein] ligase n=1 Tax=Speluncibacter jeojiensis TaxID=2710754 RepID=A0A9X4RBZ4_9ACTN|nr:biotin--[acetyl-CoA-carboxylase] ligase [Rhodococcus sp. D2-41]MDG3008827.1 biotin--[acetyl-CoA-carboxylase] ligase [Rhodococcus sp. D2-41]MDG3012964.1 biotin--[acetyl-CoA-carboxylase] ligase [Corynebacteriales bacterium D3-21]
MYSDLSRPPLNAASLRRGLVEGPRATWSQLDVVAETGSTNADLLERIHTSGDPESLDRTVLIAEHQNSGRGRHARPWTSPPRAQISMSVVVRNPGVDPSALGWLPLLTGVAVVDALRSIAEVDAELKWPNDVLVGGRKICGILAEVAAPSGHGGAPTVVVGMGLNTGLREEELPVATATSLVLEGAACVDRDPVIRAVLRALADRIDQWHKVVGAGVSVDEALVAAYRARCATLGQRVRAILPGDRELIGIAEDVDEEGRLLIRPEAGAVVAVSAGDVTHLRPHS